MTATALDRESIGDLLMVKPPLIEEYISLHDQLQPNGFDLTLRDVQTMTSAGSMGDGPDQRELPDTVPVPFGPGGWTDLQPGPYLLTFNEIINLPLNLTALGFPRSSLLRSGVSIHTAVGDAGYRGRPQALMVVHNPSGYRVRRNARLWQLVFFQLARPESQGYQGRFLGENL